MLFKVDENLHADVVALLRQRGHDAMSVPPRVCVGHQIR